MSLYHEAAEILTTARNNGGSLKSLALGKKGWKSDAKTLFALTTEAAKWSDILSEVVEKAGILQHEKNLSPTLALLLTHDLLLARKGVALPDKHGLSQAVHRHKARLTAELTKSRIRRGVASLDDLRKTINSDQSSGVLRAPNGHGTARHPRWIRINTLRTTLEQELASTFVEYERVESLEKIITAAASTKGLLYIDPHIPNLVATTGLGDPNSMASYKEGKLIFQEKASCFPAYLLGPSADDGDVIDACAAPGNKTTHLAAILGNSCHSSRPRIVACEKDAQRSRTLEAMVRLASAQGLVSVRRQQNFLKLEPLAKEFTKVTALLLDPSCSGSGIVGRDEANITVHLPSAVSVVPSVKGKKRKRGQSATTPHDDKPAKQVVVEETADVETDDKAKLQARLQALSDFQLRLLQHAMSFPAARKISYSTCSVHAEENENVVVRALLSDVGRQRGWRVMRREEQVDGMRRWGQRGLDEAVREAMSATTQDLTTLDVAAIAQACIRCDKGGEQGTMGFFVAGFIREPPAEAEPPGNDAADVSNDGVTATNDEDEWNGFDEDET